MPPIHLLFQCKSFNPELSVNNLISAGTASLDPAHDRCFLTFALPSSPLKIKNKRQAAGWHFNLPPVCAPKSLTSTLI